MVDGYRRIDRARTKCKRNDTFMRFFSDIFVFVYRASKKVESKVARLRSVGIY